MHAAKRLDAPDRSSFFAYVAMAMRSIIVDLARGRARLRRGGAFEHVDFDTDHELPGDLGDAAQIIRVHEAVDEIAQHDRRLSQIVEMRYFGGFDDEEIAQALAVSLRTVGRDWKKARLLLMAALR
jgi:RNA polymerase sigma factor (TIGR02999 family)